MKSPPSPRHDALPYACPEPPISQLRHHELETKPCPVNAPVRVMGHLRRHPEAIILGWSPTPALARRGFAERLAESKCRKKAINFAPLADLDAFQPIESGLRYRAVPHMVRNQTTVVEGRTAIIKGKSSEARRQRTTRLAALLRERIRLLVMAGAMIAFRHKQPWQCASDGALIGDCATATARRLGIVMAPGVYAVEVA